ncbi:MAG: hypothetical protein KBD21_05380 [Candidatus Pacebacteria bacterium]|nr:hypothetical protein [Candidatus Paceibacterota bacterium]
MDTIHTKSVLTTVLATLGVIFVLVILIISYLVVADPLHIKPMLFGSSSRVQQTPVVATVVETGENAPTTQATNESFTLSEAQKVALSGLGIDPATVPSTISPIQVACFEEALGVDRVSEIRAGGVPSAFELLKVKSCIN